MDYRKNGFRIVPVANNNDVASEPDLRDGNTDSLRQRNDELAQILDLLPTGIVIIDPESHTIIDANTSALAMIGASKGEVVGAICHKFICPAPYGECPYTDKGMAVSESERKLITYENEELQVLKTIIPIQYQGRPALLENIVDISAQKQAEAAARERETAFTVMSNSAQDAIISINQKGKIYFWNKAAERIFGYTADEALDCDAHLLLVPEEYLDKMRAGFAAWQITGGGPVVGNTVELTARKKNQEVIPIELSLSSVFFNHQWNAIAMIRDISERKLGEIEIKKNNERMMEWISELEQSNLEQNLLRQMGDLLQACSSVEEAYAVVARYAPSLFPGSTGAVYSFNEEHKAMELAVNWGTVVHSEYFFHTDECWALRRNQMHCNEPEDPGFRCRHLETSFIGAYLDIPLILSGDLLGLIYLELPSSPTVTERAKKLAPLVAEHLALSFSNLKLRERLREQSIRDPLTSLFNRRYMMETLERELHRANRHQHPISIIMLDIDNFKQLNDTYGHDAGDAVLKEVSQRMLGTIRGSDFACRWGGEEFVIVMPTVPLDRAGSRAEQLKEMIGQFPFIYADRNLGEVTVSIGVAVYPEHGANADQVLIEADRALYIAKRGGKNMVVIA